MQLGGQLLKVNEKYRKIEASNHVHDSTKNKENGS